MSYRDLLRATRGREQQRENEAREGQDLLRQRTSGTGQFIAAQVHQFGNPFVFKPDVSYGSEIVTTPDLDEYELPRCTGSVLRWERDSRGFYTGVYVYVDVVCAEIGTPTAVATPLVDHFFIFTALSYKDLPTVLANLQDPALPTLDVGV